MKPNQRAFFGSGQMCISKHRLSVVAALLGVAFAPNIRAFELQTDNPDTKVRWTLPSNTARRSAQSQLIQRLSGQRKPILMMVIATSARPAKFPIGSIFLPKQT